MEPTSERIVSPEMKKMLGATADLTSCFVFSGPARVFIIINYR